MDPEVGKKPKISRIKTKMIYFEASMENIWKFFQFSNLNNSLQEHFNPIKLYIF